LSVVFFTDRDLGKRFPAILASAGLDVERHHDLFPPDGSDEQWLEYVGTQGVSPSLTTSASDTSETNSMPLSDIKWRSSSSWAMRRFRS